MRWLIFLSLSGCFTAYHNVKAGWVSGSDASGGLAHGGMVIYQAYLVPDDKNYGIGGGVQFWATNREDSYGVEIAVSEDFWTRPLQEVPLGLHAEGSLLVPLNGPGIPMGLAVRGGPYIGEGSVRGSLMLHTQASLTGVPVFQFGTLAGIRWEGGLLSN